MRALVVAIALTGCATAPPLWLRVDGKPVQGIQFEADQTSCRGEADKANLSSTMKYGLSLCESGICAPREDSLRRVFAGCMAQKGYVARQAPNTP